MEAIEQKWARLSINGKEVVGLDFNDVALETDSIGNPGLCVVGRFANDRDVSIDALQHTLAPIWRPVKKMVASRASPARFVF